MVLTQEQRNESSQSQDLTPKKLLFWDTTKSNETQKLEEELMTTRIREVETLTELKELRLKVHFSFCRDSVHNFCVKHFYFLLKHVLLV